MVSGGHRGQMQFILGWLVVVMAGLFVPLMDNDSAHHANIALRMYLTGDYVSLIDYDGPYLDKPHLHFWLTALSYHLFGVTGFAYKFPSFLFSLVGIWSVYRSGILINNKDTGFIAAVVYASSASFLLSLNDVRMDAILTSSIAISIWQLLGYLKHGSRKYMLGLATGLAIGFCTKGHIAIVVPVLFALFYMFFKGDWRPLFNLNILGGIALFLLFISPVVYCYYKQFNLHPEVVVRGKDQINGIRFILLDQSIGRYGGEMGGDGKGDKLFFFHTFLWAFAPWSILLIASLIIKKVRKHLGEFAKSVIGVLVVFGVLIGLSSFKLPHYLNVILPLAALLAAEIVIGKEVVQPFLGWTKWVVWLLIGVISSLVLVWWFPEQSVMFWVGFTVLLINMFYVAKKNIGRDIINQINNIAAGVFVIFWILNMGFYPSLLRYQGGKELASVLENEKINKPVLSLEGFYSSSFYFYYKQLRAGIEIGAVENNGSFLLFDQKQEAELIKKGIVWKREWSATDYEITRIGLKFLNPETRQSLCTKIKVVELVKN
jgi:4-amino-4-deoxy-L-arabinose transferase-like glycosyltransferase